MMVDNFAVLLWEWEWEYRCGAHAYGFGDGWPEYCLGWEAGGIDYDERCWPERRRVAAVLPWERVPDEDLHE